MKKISEIAHSLTDKRQLKPCGIGSLTGDQDPYPLWLRDFFTMMNIAYGSRWSDLYLHEAAFRTGQRFWYSKLNGLDPKIIIEAANHHTARSNFTPTPSEILAIVKMLSDRKKDALYFKAIEEKRLEYKKPKLTKEYLEAKIKMWSKLGRFDKAKEAEDEIARLGL